MPKPPSTTDSPDSKDFELAQLRAQNAEQATQIAELLQRIRELEARLGKDSHNSSKPPSSDPPFKKPPPRSRRVRSGKKPYGEKDHPGELRGQFTEFASPSGTGWDSGSAILAGGMMADRPAGIRAYGALVYEATVPPRSEKLLILTVPSGKRATTSN